MANQDIRKTYSNAMIDLEEMIIYEYDCNGDLTSTHSLQTLLEELTNFDFLDLTISYKSTIKPDTVQ